MSTLLFLRKRTSIIEPLSIQSGLKFPTLNTPSLTFCRLFAVFLLTLL
ncbi:MAG: hypothetical protein ACRC10_11945 [Thermoguttaceae bacterium]